jgi:CubicO group peptidase (beta-lactamase class C family)
MSLRTISICMKVSFLSICMLFFQFAEAQYDFSAIELKLQSAKKELGANAFVMVYKDGKTIYQKGIGEFQIKTQAPIGFASQWLTTALVMTFVDQGKLSLDDRVSKYLPFFTKFSKGYITIRQCLAHLTGIESDPIRSSMLSKSKFESLEEEVETYASKKDIESNPGLEFRYGLTGINIVARVLEVITRRSFDQLMQEKLTRPMMMRNTTFSSMLGAPNPSAGALSSPFDYTNFLSMILNKGMFNGKRILSEKAVADMLTPQTTPAMIKYTPAATAGYNYGMGTWILQTDENGNASVAAAPGMFGTWPLIDLCRGYSVVIFTDGKRNEEKKEIWMEIKKIIDEQIKPICN